MASTQRPPAILRFPVHLLATLVSLGLAIPAARAASPGDGAATTRVLTAAQAAQLAAKEPATLDEIRYRQMSAMGARAAGLRGFRDPDHSAAPPIAGLRALPPERTGLTGAQVIGSADILVNGSNEVGLQSETAIAINAGGTVLVAGYNDATGFPAPGNPDQTTLSVSGVARSTDGGATWNPVPVGPGGTGVLPTVTHGSVFGDPDVKYDPTRDLFVYSSIYVRPSDGRQGVCIHFSNSTASTWTGPVEVSPSFISGASGDKPMMDVNRNTGRIMITWTSFGSTTISILSSFSDNLGTTWSSPVTLVSVGLTSGVQASVPRFLPGATNATSTVYVVWSTSPTSTTNNLAARMSADGGSTWGAGATTLVSSNFTSPDQILGVDRVNSFPGVAVDYSTGRVYVVYQAGNAQGTGDIAFLSWVGAPVAQAPKLLDSNPGSDRAQFLPAVTVDQGTHRVHVIWYDQDPQASGDVTELMHAFSDDAGATWSRPVPVLDRPFHIGYGNDTSQPNVGDYLEAVAQGGTLHSLAASTAEMCQFNEGLPALSLISPDVYYDQTTQSAAVASLRLGTVSMTEACASAGNGFLDPGETGLLTFPLLNYVANANDSPVTYTGVSATLATSTPGVTILASPQSYSTIAPLATVSNPTPFQIKLDPSLVAGTYVHLLLTVTTDQGTTQLPYVLTTGTPGTVTSLIHENFEGVTPPALPTGWSSVIGLGTDIPWVTSSTFSPLTTKFAFHTETANGSARWSRLFSPIVTVPTPASQAFVTLDFDLAYRLEDDPTRLIQAFDGLTVRLTDQTGATVIRSVLAEAFAEQLHTGSLNHFPKHLPRAGTNSPYFEDMSVWSGNSNGVVHVAMKFPGAGMVGRSVQLRFEYTEDAAGTCTNAGYPSPCGIGLDNVNLALVPVVDAHYSLTASSATVTSDQNPAPQGATVNFTAAMTPNTATGTVEFFDGVTSLGTAPVVSGSATLGTSSLSTGTHSITAQYSGDFCTASSTSPPLSQQITNAAVAPGSFAFALQGLVPNPGRSGAATVAFALASAAPARLQVLDVSGRRVLDREVGPLGAGRHRVDLARGGALAPGLYLIRLEQAGRSATTRALVLR